MAIFISYSHEDADFVDQLAMHLVAENAHIWVDRWELHVGDSLRRKVEVALEQASAVVFVLSPASVESDWCQRELSAGLVRELEERRIVVLPILRQDCAVPLFLRDKFYADFRTDFDKGLRQVLEALARVSSQSLGRVQQADGHVDWATNWGVNDDGDVLLFGTIVQQGADLPYCVVSRFGIELNKVASRRHAELVAAGAEVAARQLVIESIADVPELSQMKVLLRDAEAVKRELGVRDASADLEFRLHVECQRLGEDTGRDILVPMGNVIRELAAQTRSRIRPLDDTAAAKAVEIIRKYKSRGGRA
jgi:hypothetical protein